RRRGDEVKAAEAAHFDARIERRVEVDPATPLPRAQRDLLPALLDGDRVAVGGDGDGHGDGDVGRRTEQLVRRTLDGGVDDAFVVLELHDLDGELVRRAGAMEVQLRGEVERLADAAGDVGDGEAGTEMVAVAEGVG